MGEEKGSLSSTYSRKKLWDLPAPGCEPIVPLQHQAIPAAEQIPANTMAANPQTTEPVAGSTIGQVRKLQDYQPLSYKSKNSISFPASVVPDSQHKIIDGLPKDVNDDQDHASQKGRRYFYYFYPKTITSTCLAVIFVILMGHLYLSDDRSSFIGNYAFTLLFYFFIVFFYRLIVLIHEAKHSRSRYGNDYVQLVKAAFTFNIQSILVFNGCILYIVYYLTKHGLPIFQTEFCILTVLLFCLHKILDLDSNPQFDSISRTKGKGLDYGSGMAYSFFYGYLIYILPKSGDQNKNLKELMQDYEEINDIKFENYKIYILIPRSLICHDSVADASKHMEMRGSLPDKYLTVAGVRNRVYKNTVYSIEDGEKKGIVYVCTEYATPLKTFNKVIENITLHTEYYSIHRNDVLMQFYLTLKQILEREFLDHMCELVYYEDMDENDKFCDVGRVLLDRMVKEPKRRQDPKDE